MSRLTSRDEGESDEEERVSRSQKKREDEARQVLAHAIVALDEKVVRRLPLSADARAAVAEAAAIHPRVAHRRAVMHLAGLLRHEDETAIRLALSELDSRTPNDPFEEQADAWLARIKGGDATCLQEVAERCPSFDWTQARQLVRNLEIDVTGRSRRAEQQLRAYLIELAETVE